jgi:hypothetical protein
MVEELDDEAQYYIDLPWQDHPVREFLFQKLRSDEIPVDSKMMKPFDVWNKYCDEDIFEGMVYDGTFTRRLNDLRKAVKEGQSRADMDAALFEIAKANHPVPALNHRGEPQWNGSDAQRLLSVDMDNRKHYDLPQKELWESRPEYLLFHLTTFRDHIHQEHKTRKYLHTLNLRAEEKRKKQILEVKETRAKEAANLKKSRNELQQSNRKNRIRKLRSCEKQRKRRPLNYRKRKRKRLKNAKRRRKGQLLNCRKSRLRSCARRPLQRAKISSSSYFVTTPP